MGAFFLFWKLLTFFSRVVPTVIFEFRLLGRQPCHYVIFMPAMHLSPVCCQWHEDVSCDSCFGMLMRTRERQRTRRAVHASEKFGVLLIQTLNESAVSNLL